MAVKEGDLIVSDTMPVIQIGKINGTPVLNRMPDGWRKLEGATTAPQGYVWICNNKSRMSGERETALIPKGGIWIPVKTGRGGHECSYCRNYAPSYKTGEEHLTRYCPECGTKMMNFN